MAVHFQTLKVVIQNNSYNINKLVNKGGYSHNQIQYDSDTEHMFYICLDYFIFVFHSSKFPPTLLH